MTKTLRFGGTTTVSTIDGGMSAAVRDQLNTISSGLADRLAIANHFSPANTVPFTTDPNALGVGWFMDDPLSTPILIEDETDPAAPFGKRADVYVPDGAEVRIDSVVHGAAPLIQTLDDVSALTSNWHFTHHPAGGPNYKIKNWRGDNAANVLLTVPGGIVDSTHVRLGAHVTNGGTTYVCIQTHDSDATTEPGVGASWASYWTAVATLAIAPAAWTTATRFQACDHDSADSGWGADPASGAAVLRFSGSTGNHSLRAIPSMLGRSLYGDIHYIRFISKVQAGFKINDETGGDKGAEISMNPQSFMGAPGWGGFGPDGFVPGMDDFPTVCIAGAMYSVTELDGTTHTLGVDSSLVGQTFATGITRGDYVVFEILFKMSRTRGVSGDMWWYANGVPTDVSNASPASNGQSHHTFRIGDQYYPPVVEMALRALGLNQATTVGGGGSMSIPGRHTYIAEWMYSVGVSESGVATDHFDITCEEGATPSAGSPIHFVAELRDADDVRMDVYNDEWNPGSGRKVLHMTPSSGTAALIATTQSPYFAGDGLGRVRIQVTGATPGVPLTLDLSLDEVANNDKLTGNHFDGTITVNPT